MFRMGDWEPDEQARVASSDLFVWVVPAQVAGTWIVTRGKSSAPAVTSFELALDQKYQQVSGSARVAGETLPLSQVLLRGDEIRFAFSGAGGTRLAFAGRVAGDRIAGADPDAWSAVRIRAR
jgi:hypothetical protein